MRARAALATGLAVALVPATAWANSMSGLFGLLLAVALGVPFALLLAGFGGYAIYAMARKLPRPGFARFLLAFPVPAALVYALGGYLVCGDREGGAFLLFSAPILIFVLLDLALGMALHLAGPGQRG
jgi:hypothetical protein